LPSLDGTIISTLLLLARNPVNDMYERGSDWAYPLGRTDHYRSTTLYG
jgi:hypothetical protein